MVTLGFCLSAVLIPLWGILAHARLQGTIFDFGKKVSTQFSLVYSYSIYMIAAALPSPRTAAVTHEIAVKPFLDIPSWVTSSLYFAVVFLLVYNRSKILDVMGKILTPGIMGILIIMIIMIVVNNALGFSLGTFSNPFSHGIIEGYQTFDAIAAVVVGGVLIISINQKHHSENSDTKKTLLIRAGYVAGVALFVIYGGLILSGSLLHEHFEDDITRTGLLSGMAQYSLGNYGNFILSILVSLSCFTTAVGIVTGTADFVCSRYDQSRKIYVFTALVACLIGIGIGQFDVAYIIAIALPALMFIYPITIVLIILNVLPQKWCSPLVFKAVVATTFLFSIPDFLGSIPGLLSAKEQFTWIPLSAYSLGWVLPAMAIFLVINLKKSWEPV